MGLKAGNGGPLESREDHGTWVGPAPVASWKTGIRGCGHWPPGDLEPPGDLALALGDRLL